MFRIYFATFSLSKFFIIFRPQTKFRSLWHTFCCNFIDNKKISQIFSFITNKIIIFASSINTLNTKQAYGIRQKQKTYKK